MPSYGNNGERLNPGFPISDRGWPISLELASIISEPLIAFGEDPIPHMDSPDDSVFLNKAS